MGVIANQIQDELSISTQGMGWILGAFAIGYALFQVPGGWIGDRYGPRKVLSLAILFYSLLLVGMAIIPQLSLSRLVGFTATFAAIRLLIGAGEAFTAPNSARFVGSWMSSGARGLGMSFTTIGVGAGGVITPFLVAWTTQRYGWRASVELCGFLGVAVALVWALCAKNRPSTPIPRVGFGSHNLPKSFAFSSSSTLALLFSYACRSYTMFFFDTWFFTYLMQVRGANLLMGGFWAASPYLAVLLLAPLGGMVSDLAVRKFGRRRGRQTAVWLGMTFSATFVWAGGHVANNAVAISLVAIGAGFNMFASISWWATCIDVAPNFAASLGGLMNMCGGLAGFVAPIITAYVATRFGWIWALNSIAILCVASSLVWFMVNADENLEKAPTAA